MENSKVVKKPLAQHFKLCKAQCPATQEEKSDMSAVPYANLVGSLICTLWFVVDPI